MNRTFTEEIIAAFAERGVRVVTGAKLPPRSAPLERCDAEDNPFEDEGDLPATEGTD